MSPKWWSMPWDPNVAARSEASAFDETIRLMNQFTYHHLVVQLHLPYLLQPSSAAQNYEHNKLAAAVSSRAIITQFVAFRQPASRYASYTSSSIDSLVKSCNTSN
ncbi:hypothetical protein C1H76_5170 [Elsinoe australis]|uniref:Uncharacterized protein n=1 Tax=Elsinoe australis TaxID=40998 RepID=A0A4U7AV81_9PEZI|nr:hypothetical protein C1H76_5170 [Elsinoe australis]